MRDSERRPTQISESSSDVPYYPVAIYSMAVPSVLDYARCHALALDHLSERPLAQFKFSSSDDYGGSLQLCEPIVPDYDDILLHDKLQVSTEAFVLLAKCMKLRSDPDWPHVLEDDNVAKNLKVEEALLVSNHERDLEWFRKGLNLPKLMREHKGPDPVPVPEADDLRGIPENCKILSPSTHEEITEERLQMSQEAMHTLAACVLNCFPEKDIEEVMNGDLNMEKSRSIEVLTPLLSPQLSDGESNHGLPPVPLLDLEPRSEIELDADNLLFQLEKTAETRDQIYTSGVEAGSTSIVREIMNTASVTLPIETTPFWDFSSTCARTSTPAKNHMNEIKLEASIVLSPLESGQKSRISKRVAFKDVFEEFIDVSPRLEENIRTIEPEEGEQKKHLLQCFDQHEDQVKKDIENGKFEVTDKTLRVKVPGMGRVAVADTRAQISAREIATETFSHSAIDPIDTTVEDEARLNWVPIPHELMRLELTEKMEEPRLGDHIDKPDKILRSELLLYRESGLRILEEGAEDEEMEQDDSLTSCAEQGTLAPIIPQKRPAEDLAIHPSGAGRSEVLESDLSINETNLLAAERVNTSVSERQEGKPPTEKVPHLPQHFPNHIEADEVPESIAQAKKIKFGKLSPHKDNQGSADTFSAAGSLASFLDLRGGKFKKPALPIVENRKEQKGSLITPSETVTDPILGSQIQTPPKVAKLLPWVRSGSLRRPNELIEVPCTPNGQVSVDDKISHPELRQLNELRTIVLDSVLVNNRQLIAFIEKEGNQHLMVIYRDLHSLPDVILNPKACIIYTNLQALTQKTLPGRKTKPYTVQDRIRNLAGSFDTIFVLVKLCVSLSDVGDSQMKAMVDFGSFCACLKMSQLNGDVVPLWMPIQDGVASAAAFEDPICRWTWDLIFRYAFRNIVVSDDGSATERPLALIQDETLWELFLCKAGMNPMAAQVILGWLKRPDRNEAKFVDNGHDGYPPEPERTWGLGRFVSMTSDERLKLFDGIVGLRTMNRINEQATAPALAPPGFFRNAPRPNRNTFSFLRYLFPHIHQRARARFLDFHLDTLPRYKLQAQSRIYQALVKRERRRRERVEAGRGFRAAFGRFVTARVVGRKGRAAFGRPVRERGEHEGGERGKAQQINSRPAEGELDHGQTGEKEVMASSNTYGSYSSGYGSGQYGQPRAVGARREKVKGYLRAANELRQSYQAQLERRMQGDEEQMPGSFPDVEIVRSGEEEMLLFPSYARKHIKRKREDDGTSGTGMPGSREGIESPPQGQQETLVSSGDQEYWKREWERYEDANAVVDVDVRGWIYSPQKGPLNRKNRLLIAVARRLSGIPAPTQQDDGWPGSREPSPSTAVRRPNQGLNSEEPNKHEEMAAAKEAENIARRGKMEADAAARGSYSTGMAGTNSARTSRSNSPAPGLRRQLTGNSTDSEIGTDEDDTGIQRVSKRSSWNEPAGMSREEQLKANELLMMRLRPFMTLPLTNTTITVFFFNENKSSSKSVTTNDSGHFNVRAALDFVPTQVRVLASENLSATEDVVISEMEGVSLISDVDDTIKHSAIASGAREIFKNTFVRELGDLTIQGVREWYTKMASMGVQMHYVSNSPWQLYPLLKSYFSLAGLPPGSFHLKQYSGMLQGIFEPAAERKRGSLDRIMNDFPERKFILVGDSGEADLEVYTDVVTSHPGRVLAVFIRDVTTPLQRGFFDQSISNSPPDSMISSRNGTHHSRTRDEADIVSRRPALPARPVTDFGKSGTSQQSDLIDFSDEPETVSLHEAKSSSYSDDLRQLEAQHGPHGQPPSKPNKPSNLRNFSVQSPITPTNPNRPGESLDRVSSAEANRTGPPPKPRRSSQSVNMPHSVNQAPDSRPPFSSSAQNRRPEKAVSPGMDTSNTNNQRPQLSSRTTTSSSLRSNNPGNQDEGYVAAARRGLNTAYNALPALRSTSQTRPETSGDGSAPPPIPPRRGLASYPAAAARWATGATGGDPAAGGDGGAPGASYNKKEEMWKRRWARAEEIMGSRGVVLRSWRVGADVMDECVRIVKRAQKGGRVRVEGGGNGEDE